jgi:cytochrome c oxidase cbb3-type subunit 3
MVGVGRRDIVALWTSIERLSGSARLTLAVALTLGVLIVVVWGFTVRAEARLVRSDPNAEIHDAGMMRFGAARGHGVYQAHCANCHGANAKGNPTMGVPNLTDNDWLYGDGEVSDIETVVQYGVRASNGRTWRLADMPAFAHHVPYPREPAIKPLSPGDIADVVQFLRVLRHAPADGAAASRGSTIFGGRGGCYDCHGSDGRGDPAIGAPNLADATWLYGDGSDRAVFDSIANGRAGICPAWFERLGAAQIREAALYVYALSHGQPQPMQGVR